eukprot:m.357015 g.357015  ORF g.357015 m.357015 type:complete len:440 (+) comp17683_c0_seq1:194-1513(+)
MMAMRMLTVVLVAVVCVIMRVSATSTATATGTLTTTVTMNTTTAMANTTTTTTTINPALKLIDRAEAVRIGAKFGAISTAGFAAAYVLAMLAAVWTFGARMTDWCCYTVGCECCGAFCCEDADHITASHGHHGASESFHTGEKDNLSEALLDEQPHASSASLEAYAEAGTMLQEAPGADPDQDEKGGDFGLFMIMIEFLDAIPEALVVGDSVVNGELRYALVASIFVLNFASGFAMFGDMMRSKRKDGVKDRSDHVLFVSATLAAGMLMFTIADEVYGEFDKFGDGAWPKYLLVLGGTLVGSSLVLGLMWFATAKGGQRVKETVANFFHSNSSTLTCAITNRVLKAFVLMIALCVWMISLTVISVYVFHGESVKTAFVEGVSGGAFLITVSGTLIPEAQKAASELDWSLTRKAAVGATSFVVGLLLAVTLAVAANTEAE